MRIPFREAELHRAVPEAAAAAVAGVTDARRARRRGGGVVRAVYYAIDLNPPQAPALMAQAPEGSGSRVLGPSRKKPWRA